MMTDKFGQQANFTTFIHKATSLNNHLVYTTVPPIWNSIQRRKLLLPRHHGVTLRWKDRIKKLDKNINWKPPTSTTFTWSCHVDQDINLVLPYIMTPRVSFMHSKNNCVKQRALTLKRKVQWVCMPARWWCIIGTVTSLPVSGTLLA